jgi:hypothetical protein
MTAEQPTPQPPPEISHPYAVAVPLTLGTNAELAQVEEEVTVAFAGGVVWIVKDNTPQTEVAASLKRVTVHLEAFQTACAAERAGKLFALSLLWMVASNCVTVGLRKWMGELPFAVRDRTRSDGISVHGEGRAYFTLKPGEIAAVAGQVYAQAREVQPHMLTSMQFYAAARLEASEGARFITLMIALEALAEQKDYGDEVAGVFTELTKQLEQSPALPRGRKGLDAQLAGRPSQAVAAGVSAIRDCAHRERTHHEHGFDPLRRRSIQGAQQDTARGHAGTRVGEHNPAA